MRIALCDDDAACNAVLKKHIDIMKKNDTQEEKRLWIRQKSN